MKYRPDFKNAFFKYNSVLFVRILFILTYVVIEYVKCVLNIFIIPKIKL